MRDDLLLSALARGASREVASRESGISVRTIARRVKSAEFMGQVRVVRQQMIDGLSRLVDGAGRSAVAALLELLQRSRSETVRLGAARAILENLPVRCHLERLAEETPLDSVIEVRYEGLRESILRNRALRARQPATISATFEETDARETASPPLTPQNAPPGGDQPSP